MRGRAEMERFIRLPHALFRGDPAWVPPLLAERRAALSSKKNPWFRHAEAAFRAGRGAGLRVGGRWLAGGVVRAGAVQGAEARRSRRSLRARLVGRPFWRRWLGT